MLGQFLTVAFGGAVGAICRYGLALWLNIDNTGGDGRLFWGTLAANWIGSFLAGVMLAWAQSATLSEPLRLGFSIGLLGALTTFSTFAAETLSLVTGGHLEWALLHIGLNLIGALSAVSLAWWLASSFVWS